MYTHTYIHRLTCITKIYTTKIYKNTLHSNHAYTMHKCYNVENKTNISQWITKLQLCVLEASVQTIFQGLSYTQNNEKVNGSKISSQCKVCDYLNIAF